MADYLEVVQFRKAGDKWKPVRLGAAKKNDKGQLNVYLDALPIPDHEGNCRFVIQQRQQQNQQQPKQDVPPMPPGLDGEAPF